MAESKRASMAGDRSEEPTIAPSPASFEKAEPASAEAPTPNEMQRAATAASRAGAQSLRPATTREDGSDYPTGLALGLITMALCLSVFLIALDNSIIGVAIPKITDEFHSLGDVGWYGSGKSPSAPHPGSPPAAGS